MTQEKGQVFEFGKEMGPKTTYQNAPAVTLSKNISMSGDSEFSMHWTV